MDGFDCRYCDKVYGSEEEALQHALENHGDEFDEEEERDRLKERLAALRSG